MDEDKKRSLVEDIARYMLGCFIGLGLAGPIMLVFLGKDIDRAWAAVVGDLAWTGVCHVESSIKVEQSNESLNKEESVLACGLPIFRVSIPKKLNIGTEAFVSVREMRPR